MNNRLEQFINAHKLIPEFQAGFRKKRGCIENLFVLNSLVQIHSVKNHSIFCIFVDFQKAFDSVDHEILFNKLYNLNISSKFLKILHCFYSQASACIKVNNERTESVSISRGVLQDEILSPSLFSLFLHDIESYMKRKGCRGVSVDHKTEVDVLAYADDIVLFADTPLELEKKLNALHFYCSDNKLIINETKT